MNRHSLFLLLVATVLLTGCTDYAKVLKTSSLETRYEAAKQYYYAGKNNRSATILNDLIMPMKGSDQGEEALFMLGMANYNGKNYDAAASTFQRYYKSYPRGTYAETARFYSGLALYKSTPEPRLDQTDTYTAITEFSNFLEQYPSSSYRKEAEHLIFEMQDKLVEKEYLSAKLYYKLGSYFGNCTNGGSNYEACVITAQNAIKDYPYCKRREDLAILVLKAKFDLAAQSVESKKVERYQDAIDEFYGFQNEYPESHFMADAKKLYEKAKPYESLESDDSLN